ncbi:MAG: alpha/beta fold hydrolase [Casimicrobiaceae bacterium]
MLPAEAHLEVRSRIPERASADRPPLLFVHGGFCDGWCWEPYFLPWFASQGYACHALSLRGHGTSGGRDSLFLAGLDDYAADVERVAALLPAPPVLIGHSMGAAVVERLLATRPVRAAALLAPVPPAGLMVVAARLAAAPPDYLMQLNPLDPGRLPVAVLLALEPYYFSETVRPAIRAEAARHIGEESPRALFDLSLRLHWQLPERRNPPLLVLGAEGDCISTPEDVHATARHHGVEAVIVKGLAHLMMLDKHWLRAARPIAAWLKTQP